MGLNITSSKGIRAKSISEDAVDVVPKIVVLTATIDPTLGNVSVVLSDKQKRLEQYLNNIKKLILESDFKYIIFCENSRYSYDYSALIQLAKQYNKDLEILSFMGSNEIIKIKGRGFGEGEILNYAIEHSSFLKTDADLFYKLTGRIYVENINKILTDTRCNNIFIRWDFRKNEVDTRFFKTHVGFFKDNLSHLLHSCGEINGMSIEEVYYRALKGNPNVDSFTTYPVIKGMCATLGKPYDLGFFKLNYRKLQLKIGLLDLRKL